MLLLKGGGGQGGAEGVWKWGFFGGAEGPFWPNLALVFVGH